MSYHYLRPAAAAAAAIVATCSLYSIQIRIATATMMMKSSMSPKIPSTISGIRSNGITRYSSAARVNMVKRNRNIHSSPLGEITAEMQCRSNVGTSRADWYHYARCTHCHVLFEAYFSHSTILTNCLDGWLWPHAQPWPKSWREPHIGEWMLIPPPFPSTPVLSNSLSTLCISLKWLCRRRKYLLSIIKFLTEQISPFIVKLEDTK